MTEIARGIRSRLPFRVAATPSLDGARRTLVILATPRSGTHLLAHELAASGQVGLAEEFFHDQLIGEFGERFDAEIDDLSGYIDAWHTATAAPTGVAAVVVFPDHVNKLAAAGKLSATGPAGFVELLALLPEPSVVLLERQSITDQAISFNRSTQSWVWTRTAGQDAPPHPTYDFESLTAHLLRLITIRQWALDAAASIGDQLLLRIAYESLVADPASTVRAVCSALGLDSPATGTKATDRPERAADGESQTRATRLRDDLAILTSRLRWAPGDSAAGPGDSALVGSADRAAGPGDSALVGSADRAAGPGDSRGAGMTDAVGAEVVTIADRQLSALADAVESHRASAFRRRPVADALPDAGPLVALGSAVASSRHSRLRRVQVLTHGLDQWMLEQLYRDAARHHAAVSFTANWGDLGSVALGSGDVVHLNSMSLGWGHANFDGKAALIGRARAAIAALHESGVPIIWSVNEPITPGTSHVALESAIRADIAAAASVIHVPNELVLHRANELFDVPGERVIVGDPAALLPAASPVLLRRREGPLFAVLGGLTSLPHLDKLAALVPQLVDQFGQDTTVLVVGTAQGVGSVAHKLRQLEDAGAVVVTCPVDNATARAVLGQCDLLLAPCSDQATLVPIQRLAALAETPLVMTDCPAVTTGISVDWADPTSTAGTLAHACDITPEPPEPSSQPLTIGTLLAAIE